MNRFWVVLTVIVIGLAALFVATKPDKTSTSKFTGDATKVQADDHTFGNKKAKVVLTEYGDFQCPSCGAVHPIIKELQQKYKKEVLFVYRNFPLIEIHPNAFAAARAAEAANLQGKYWEMHNKLFETQSLWGELSSNQQSTFEGYAKELGLNLDKFKVDYASEEVANRINRDVSSASIFDIQGTPTFVLNGKKIENPVDKAGYENLLKDAIKNASSKK
jgi:protein-disulfide isomerase